MSEHIKLIGQGVPVAALQWALREHLELWDENTGRTAPPDSPHHGLSDIWARYAAPGSDGSKPHAAIWYPCAELLRLPGMVDPLVRRVGGVELGGVLITRIPPGGACRPHVDNGWHARYYEKFAVQIASAPGQAFCFEDGGLVTRPGDLYWFDNSVSHWVTNDTAYERITMIVCVRRE